MPRIVRGALVQASWTGDKESMIQKHEELRPRGGQAGRPVHPVPGAVLRAVLLPGAGRPVLQLHRADPRRPDDQADAGPRQADRHGRRRPDVRGGRARPRASTTTPPPSSTPTARTWASTARPTSRTSRASGRSSTSGPGNLGYPVFETAVGKVGVYICYDRHFPEGARALGLNGAEIVLIPSATSRGLSEYLWRIEQVSHAVANGYYVGTINRVGIEADIGDDDFYGQSYFVDPRGQFVGDVGSRPRRGADRPRPGPRQDHRGPQDVAVLPRPPARRVRGPHATVGHALPSLRLGRLEEDGRAASIRRGGRPAHAVRLHAQARSHARAHPRPDPAGRGGRLRLRLAVRLARPVARAVSPADADGPGHRRGCASGPA